VGGILEMDFRHARILRLARKAREVDGRNNTHSHKDQLRCLRPWDMREMDKAGLVCWYL
jgi:hypothetical protein